MCPAYWLVCCVFAGVGLGCERVGSCEPGLVAFCALCCGVGVVRRRGCVAVWGCSVCGCGPCVVCCVALTVCGLLCACGAVCVPAGVSAVRGRVWGDTKGGGPLVRAPLSFVGLCGRRCPTLPHPGGCSTIGAGSLSFRVRKGKVRACPCRYGRRHACRA